MREVAPLLRERESGRGPAGDFIGRHHPTWAIAVVGGVLLAGVGAFGTGETQPWTSYSYWGVLMAAGAFAAALLMDAMPESPSAPSGLLRRVAGATLALTLAMTPLVWLLSALALHGGWEIGRMPEVFRQTLLVVAVFVIVQLALYRQLGQRAAPAPIAPMMPDPGRPALLDRLPAKLRGAELLAVEAEDHYLRFHTDKGSALLLMRLADAAAELEALDGAQTHRSWWVARGAVERARRGGGRGRLTLRGGLTVPVSRTYAPALRRAGWF
jgi:hypothetical protein